MASSASTGTVVTQFAYRTAQEIGVVDAGTVYEPLIGFERPEGNLRCCVYSPDGRLFAWAAVNGITVIDASSGSPVAALSVANVHELSFSPFGTYLQTWERASKNEQGDAVKNLKIWNISGGEPLLVGQFVAKSISSRLHYTADEKYAVLKVTNELHIYESSRLNEVWNKIRAEGVIDFAVSPGKRFAVAIFIPERKGQPAGVQIYNVPEVDRWIVQKSFYKADKVTFKWNGDGSALLVLAQTEVDKTGKSYYGETNAYLMSATGGQGSLIQLDKEGPIHDVSWSPRSREFGIVYGYMPAKTTLFNLQGNATYSFPLGPRNTISYSPHGRYVLVAGFGNLAGQMDIYDLERNYAKVTTIEASNASVCEWSPDGGHILVATTSPRLRVDNGVRIWHLDGQLMYNEDLTELYNVVWRPQSASMHPLPAPNSSRPQPHSSAVAYTSTIKTPSKPAGAYRPPGARGEATPLHFKREDEGGSAFTSNGYSGTNGYQASARAPRRREVPGAEPVAPPGAAPGGGVSLTPGAVEDENLSKAALKNKKKREAKKARDAAAAVGGDGSNGPSPSVSHQNSYRQPSPSKQERRHERSKSRGNGPGGGRGSAPPQQQASIPPPPPPPPPAQIPEPAMSENPVDEKKVRGLVKKLRAIDELKMRLAGGEKLEDTQVKKIGSEDQVRKELIALGWDG